MFGVISSDPKADPNQDPSSPQYQRNAARLILQDQAAKSGIMINNNNSKKDAGCYGDFQQFTSLPRVVSSSSTATVTVLGNGQQQQQQQQQRLTSIPLSSPNNPNTSTLWRCMGVVTRRFSPKESTSHFSSSSSASKSAAIRVWDASSGNSGICETSTNPKNVYLLVIAGQAYEKWFSHLIPKSVVMIGTVSSTSGIIVESLQQQQNSNTSNNNKNSTTSTSAGIKIVVRDPNDICTIGFSDNIVPCGMLTGVRTNDANNSACETFVNKLKAKACLRHVVQANKIQTQQMSTSRISESAVKNAPATASSLFAIRQEQQQIQQKQKVDQQKWQLKQQQKQHQQPNNSSSATSGLSLVHRNKSTGVPLSQQEVSRIMNNSISNSNLTDFQMNNPYNYSETNNNNNNNHQLFGGMATSGGYKPSAEMTRKVETHTFQNPLAPLFTPATATSTNNNTNTNNNNLQGQQQSTTNTNSNSSPPNRQMMPFLAPSPSSSGNTNNSNDKITLPRSISSSKADRKDNERVVGNMNKLIHHHQHSTSSSPQENNNTNDNSAPSSSNNVNVSLFAPKSSSATNSSTTNPSTSTGTIINRFNFKNGSNNNNNNSTRTISSNNNHNTLLLPRPNVSSQSIVGRTLEAAAQESRRRQREEEEAELQKQKQREQTEQLAKFKQQQLMREKQNQKMLFANAVNSHVTTNNNETSSTATATTMVPERKPVFATSVGGRAEAQAEAARLLLLQQQKKNPLTTSTTSSKSLNSTTNVVKQKNSNLSSSTSSNSSSSLAASLGLPTNYTNLAKTLKSTNDDLAHQARKEEVNSKLAKIEEQGAIFDALDNVTEVQTKAYRCPICQRTTIHKQKICMDKNHPVVALDTVKRYYRCGKCKNGRLPGVGECVPTGIPCSKCGASCWERTTAAGGPGAQDVVHASATTDTTSS